jgi:hypothetical protein
MCLLFIQLLYFPDCPNVESARGALRQALANLGGAWEVAELDVTAPEASIPMRSWGSPTVLVNAADVAEGNAAGSCCRPRVGLLFERRPSSQRQRSIAA